MGWCFLQACAHVSGVCALAFGIRYLIIVFSRRKFGNGCFPFNCANAVIILKQGATVGVGDIQLEVRGAEAVVGMMVETEVAPLAEIVIPSLSVEVAEAVVGMMVETEVASLAEIVIPSLSVEVATLSFESVRGGCSNGT